MSRCRRILTRPDFFSEKIEIRKGEIGTGVRARVTPRADTPVHCMGTRTGSHENRRGIDRPKGVRRAAFLTSRTPFGMTGPRAASRVAAIVEKQDSDSLDMLEIA